MKLKESMKKFFLKKSAYRYVVFLWLSMAAFFSMFVIPFAVFIRKDTGDNFGWFLAIAATIMMLLNMPLTILDTYIVISDKGIRFKMYVRTVKTKWEDANGLVKDTASWIFKNQEGLLFTIGEIEEKPRNLIFSPVRLPMTFVPLSWFSENWQDSEIIKQVKQYAPHLFENKQSV